MKLETLSSSLFSSSKTLSVIRPGMKSLIDFDGSEFDLEGFKDLLFDLYILSFAINLFMLFLES